MLNLLQLILRISQAFSPIKRVVSFNNTTIFRRDNPFDQLDCERICHDGPPLNTAAKADEKWHRDAHRIAAGE